VRPVSANVLAPGNVVAAALAEAMAICLILAVNIPPASNFTGTGRIKDLM